MTTTDRNQITDYRLSRVKIDGEWVVNQRDITGHHLLEHPDATHAEFIKRTDQVEGSTQFSKPYMEEWVKDWIWELPTDPNFSDIMWKPKAMFSTIVMELQDVPETEVDE